MNRAVCFICLMLLFRLPGFGQVFSLDLSKPPKHHFELPEKRNSFRVDVGQNYQFFDHPFFKFSSTKYAKNAVFKTDRYGNLALEYVSVIPVGNSAYKWMGGLYFSETDFSYNFSKVHRAVGLSFNGPSLSVHQFGGGIGINRSLQLRGRLYVDLSSLLVITKSLFDWPPFIDTTLVNRGERKEKANDLWDDMVIEYPSKLPHPISFRLKNKLLLSYYFSKTIGLHLNVVYNIGIPNKLFILSV